MEILTWIILTALIFFGLGLFLGGYINSLRNKSKISALETEKFHLSDSVSELESQLIGKDTLLQQSEQERHQLQLNLVRKEGEIKSLGEKIETGKLELEKLEKRFQLEFENLATKLLERTSDKFTLKNKENIESILNPLNEKIKTFEQKVDQTHKENIATHSALKQQIFGLEKLNQQLSQEALNLTKALKGDNKAQGNWGEFVLKRVLEKSNLEEGREYFIQQSHIGEAGNRLMPDVVIQLPENKKMVIDSKVSLTAYERYSNTEDKDEQRKYLKEHITSLKFHVESLHKKKYDELYKIESPDFVLMFIPIEPALYVAQNEDNSFFYTAFEKNILLVSPTTLLSVLRTIDTLWKNEKQQQHAVEIAQHAGSLYHKFKILLDDLETVGNRLNSTSTAYESAMKKLTGNQNLIKDIDRLEKLGVSPKSRIENKWLKKADIDASETSASGY